MYWKNWVRAPISPNSVYVIYGWYLSGCPVSWTGCTNWHHQQSHYKLYAGRFFLNIVWLKIFVKWKCLTCICITIRSVFVMWWENEFSNLSIHVLTTYFYGKNISNIHDFLLFFLLLFFYKKIDWLKKNRENSNFNFCENNSLLNFELSS